MHHDIPTLTVRKHNWEQLCKDYEYVKKENVFIFFIDEHQIYTKEFRYVCFYVGGSELSIKRDLIVYEPLNFLSVA